uniref:NB-ARC domain-containing protein n=1 Tax=Setaria viridis TaxID=4556 RepID=A0A4U6V7G0_SETVI|nr:hypothetical protein SEVIR_3G047500v2 [Setaria viridis]
MKCAQNHSSLLWHHNHMRKKSVLLHVKFWTRSGMPTMSWSISRQCTWNSYRCDPRTFCSTSCGEVELQRGRISPSQPQLQHVSRWRAERIRKWDAYFEKKKEFDEIKYSIQKMKVYDKLEEVKNEVLQVKGDHLRLDLTKEVGHRLYFFDKPLGALLLLLLKSAAAAAQQDRVSKMKLEMATLAACYKYFIEATAKKLQEHLEGGAKQPIRLDRRQYEDILREVFPKTSDTKDQEQDTEQATKISITTTLDENQIKGIVDKVRQQILREPQQEDSTQLAMQDTKTTTTTLGDEDLIKETRHDDSLVIVQRVTEAESNRKQTAGKLDGSMVEETMERIETIKRKIKTQLNIKGIMDRIEQLLDDKITNTMVILMIGDTMDRSVWEETRNALSLLGRVGGALIITTSKGTQRAKEYCYPPWEPIDYSVVGPYHATVLALASQKMQQDAQIFRDIVDECAPHEFCMKIFAHALYAKPKRSNEELHQLLSTLKAVSPKTFIGIYKSCLLYLSIFPQGHNIRRSTLIGRWVAEGLITKEDWSTSVRQAERRFDAVIKRWLVYPGYIGATGKVKSSVVGAQIHGFITKIAKKQHIVEARLSHHLARHFSIFNDVRLRGSDRIDDFFRKLPKSHQLSLLKVLDLEGCHCFGGKNQSYLKDICSNISLLKYLSLKRTNVTQLPSEINHLHELEVLDIRQTEVPALATKNILLLKLKRLLAGHTVPSPSNTDAGMAVQVPDKIGKMLNMEVLSNVKPRSGRDLEDIGTLWQLKKLGLVIKEYGHLINLAGAISNLHESLRSLSITLPITSCDGTLSSTEFPYDIDSHLTYGPKLLESLSICGTTAKGSLLSVLAKYGDCLVKVTLSRASLNHDELNILAKLPMLSCVRLRHIVCAQRKVSFKENEFQKLKYFLVEGSNITDINFQHRAVLELEKIVLSSTGYLKSLSGVNHHRKLKELELNNSSRLLSLLDSAEKIAKLTLRGTFLMQHDLKILGKKPNMRCLVLLDKSCAQRELTFNKDEFPKLNILIVCCPNITKINFTNRSALKLEKIAWTFTNNKLEQAKGDAAKEDGDAARFPFCW